MLQKAWNDSVWSKVIAAGITGAFAGAGALAVGQWPHFLHLGDKLVSSLRGDVRVPIWLVLGAATLLAMSMLGVIVLVLRKAAPDRGIDDQPNAIPVALVRKKQC